MRPIGLLLALCHAQVQRFYLTTLLPTKMTSVQMAHCNIDGCVSLLEDAANSMQQLVLLVCWRCAE